MPTLETVSPLPVAASTRLLAVITGLPASALRELSVSDPTFPQPFTIREARHSLKWNAGEVVAWLSAKAGRPLAVVGEIPPDRPTGYPPPRPAAPARPRPKPAVPELPTAA